jgi:alanine racemase
MSRPIRAVIDRAAMETNLAVVRRHAPRSRVMAVIKANGYGHGVLRAALALKRADGFAVLELDAAVRLREAGYRQPVLLLEGFFGSEEVAALEEYRLSPVIHCADQLAMLSAFKRRGALDVFLKINTGMNRLGFQPAQFGAAMAKLRASPAVGSVTLMTHFACADQPGGVADQLARFHALNRTTRLPASLANSAAVLSSPETHTDWVRPGIMLYGASPFPDRPAAGFGLEPAMALKSAVIAEQDLRSGDRVGYGATFEADAPMRVGVVACGYADGYPRHAGTGTPVLVDGVRTRTLGRVSMDMLCVDLTRLPGSGTGSEVVLWGEGLPVDEVAAAAGTIGYELLCAVAPRVPVDEK